MTTPRLTLAEQETIISFSAADTTANIYSTYGPWINKIKKLEGARPYGVGWEVDVPKNWIKIAPSRKLSADEAKRRSEMMKKLRATQQK